MNLWHLSLTVCIIVLLGVHSCNGTSGLDLGKFGLYNGINCSFSSYAEPETMAELLSVMNTAKSEGKHVKATGSTHSTIPVYCAAPDNVLLSLRKMAQVIPDAEANTVTIRGIVYLSEVLDALAPLNKTLASFGGYDRISIIGSIVGGTHGSCPNRPSALSHYLVGAKVLRENIQTNQFEEYTLAAHQLEAFKNNMGLVGVITEVTLSVLDNFKVHMSTSLLNDTNLAAFMLSQFGQPGLVYSDVFWSPYWGKASSKVGWEVSNDTPGTARVTALENAFPGFLGPIVAAGQEAIQNNADLEADCTAESAFIDSTVLTPGFSDGGLPNVGWWADMTTSGDCFLSTCFWETDFKTLDIEISIRASDIGSFINDVKALNAKNPFCLKIIAVYFRLSAGGTNHPMDATRGVDTVHVGLPFFKRLDTLTANYNLDVLQELSSILMEKYNGRPHVGKNYLVQLAKIKNAYPNFNQVTQLAQNIDSRNNNNIAQNNNPLLGLIEQQNYLYYEKCAFNFSCPVGDAAQRCGNDGVHYVAKGFVYPNARVCRRTVVMTDRMDETDTTAYTAVLDASDHISSQPASSRCSLINSQAASIRNAANADYSSYLNEVVNPGSFVSAVNQRKINLHNYIDDWKNDMKEFYSC